MTSLRLGLRLVCISACIVTIPAPSAAKTLIHAGRLIDGRSDTARSSVTITIDGERIVGVSDGFATPAQGDTVIDLRAATLMPGLMDMHVHLTSQQSGASGYAERFYLNPADVALRATTYARKTL